MPSRFCLDCHQQFDASLTRGDRCPICAPKANRARQARYDRQRPNSWRRGYNGEYQRNSAPILAAATCCHWCSGAFTPDDPATIDHVVPLARGGTNDPSNLVAAHRSCNSRRGSQLRRRSA